MKNLDSIFSPRSVAVIGASSTPGKVGHDLTANILRGGYKGVLYPVNPTARAVHSIRAYPAISDVPDSVDLSMIILPPPAAVKAVEESVRKGVRGIVIVSAGFREIGPQGLRMEQRIVALCSEAGIPVVGPNCLGIINPIPDVRMNASFSARMPAAGNISFISQSGALCTAVLDFAAERDIGFSKFISIGNKADVDEVDLLEYLNRDPDTAVIMIYVEEMRNGRAFIATARQVTSGDRPTPILVIKSGRTAAGARAAVSHTGALAGSEAVYEAIFKQSGVIRAESVNELFDFANAFAFKKASPVGKLKRKLPSGNRVAIVTNAGGPGIIATDMTISADLELAELNPETVAALRESLPSAANVKNPVDIIGDAPYERYETTLRTVIRDDHVDGVLVILTPQSMTDARGTAEAVVRVAAGTYKPVICCFMGIVDVSAGVRYLRENGYPVYQFPESAAKAMGALSRYVKWLNREELPAFSLVHDRARARSLMRSLIAAGKTKIAGVEALELLSCYGFSTPRGGIAVSEDQAVRIASECGTSVALKIVSERILHKTDIGGVALNLDNEDEIRGAFRSIMSRAKHHTAERDIEGILVQQMAPHGEEIILGINRYDAETLLAFGLGGILVELYKDVVFRLNPVSRTEAAEMIREIKGFGLLTGFRGRPPADLEALERSLVGLSELATDLPEILEMDVNPLIVHPAGQGATAADCRIILQSDKSK